MTSHLTAQPYAQQTLSRARRQSARRFWLTIHLYLGLLAGAVLVLIGLTGSILAFQQEIDEFLNPHLMTVTPAQTGEAAFRPLHEIMAAADAAVPPGAKFSFGYYPRNDRAAYYLFYAVPTAALSSEETMDIYHVFINPYTAELLGKRLVRRVGDWLPHTFISVIFHLHQTLLLNEIGSLIVGFLAFAFITSVGTGVILWWPPLSKWKSALTIQRHASAQRFNYDVHKTFGISASIILIALFVSGLYFFFRPQFHSFVNLFSPTTDRYAVRSGAAAGQPPLPLSEAVHMVSERYPEGRLDWLYGASTPSSAYTICQRNLYSLSAFVGRRCVVVDQYSGKILHVQGPDTGTAGDYFVLWQWPLHSGEAFGLTGRIVVLLTGLTCPVLYITGVIRWRQKRRITHLHVKRLQQLKKETM